VEQAFSLKPPEEGISRIRVMEDDGSDTYRAVQGRALSFGVGCFMAIRNALSPLRLEEVELSEQEGLERLAAFSLLARWVEQATVLSGA